MAPQADGTHPLARITTMDAERTCRRVVVHGRVQGVFFRDSTQERADSENVTGWICNRPDGAVEAQFEGAPDAVGRMIAFCRSGPASADVQDLEVSEVPPEGLSCFEVR